MIRLCAILVIYISFFASESTADSYPNTVAIEYINKIQQNSKIYVWPTKARLYEIVGIKLEGLSGLVDGKSSDYYWYKNSTFPAPLLSIYVYDSGSPGYMNYYFNNSRLLPFYKNYVFGLPMYVSPCSFTYFSASNAWAVGGVVFADRGRLPDEAAVKDCISVGVDYVSGFPAPTDLNYQEFPSSADRAIVLDAIMRCALERSDGASQEKSTRDGFFPLPSLACVRDKISGP